MEEIKEGVSVIQWDIYHYSAICPEMYQNEYPWIPFYRHIFESLEYSMRCGQKC